VRELRGDEILAGYKAAIEEQEELVKACQEERQTYRLEWAKLEAYRCECPDLSASEEHMRRLAAVIETLEDIENKLIYHQRLAMALGRKASGIETDWGQPSLPSRLAARRAV
jgi:hypothetical protein